MVLGGAPGDEAGAVAAAAQRQGQTGAAGSGSRAPGRGRSSWQPVRPKDPGSARRPSPRLPRLSCSAQSASPAFDLPHGCAGAMMTRPRPRPGRQPPRKIASLPCSTRRRTVPAIKAAVPSVLSNAGLDGSRSANGRSPMPSHMDVRRAVSLRRRSPVEVFLDIGVIVLLRGHNRAAPDRRWHAYTLPGTANIGHEARLKPTDPAPLEQSGRSPDQSIRSPTSRTASFRTTRRRACAIPAPRSRVESRSCRRRSPPAFRPGRAGAPPRATERRRRPTRSARHRNRRSPSYV